MGERPAHSGPRDRKEGVPTGAIILVVLGIVLLLQTTGVISWEVWTELWRFWPVLIIVIGVNLFIGRRMPWLAALLALALLGGSVGIAVALTDSGGTDTVTRLTEPVDGIKSADVGIDFGAGKLRLDSLSPGSPNLVEASFQGREAEATLERRGNTGDLQISAERSAFFSGFHDVEWDISLSPAPELSLDINGGAADMELDLRGLKVTKLDLDTGAARVKVTMPDRAGHVQAQIDGGASDIDVVVPAGVAARIVSESGLSSIDIDGDRFPKSSGVHMSPDYETAENRVDIELHVGVASVTVR